MGKTKVIVLIAILSSAMVRAQDVSTSSTSSEEKYYVRPGLITANPIS